MSKLGFSVVVPVFNERDNLQALVDAVIPVMEKLAGGFELLLVDDGSSDGSSEELDRLAAADPRARALHFIRNFGQSAAIEAGIQHALGEVIVLIDADLQTDPADIPKLLPLLEKSDAVVGVRQQRKDTWWRRFSSRFANGVRNRLTREDIADTGCPLKVIRAAAARRLRMWNGAHRFIPTMLRMEGFTVTQVPVSHRDRTAGVSKYGTLDRAFRGLRDALGVRWLQDRHLDWRLK